jgi:OOP family OmpA-OmpF porin
MNRILVRILAMCAAFVAANATAQALGHWSGPVQQVWRNGFGQCWGGSGARIAECEPAVAPAPKPAPVVVAPPPPPPPAPKPAPVVEAPKPAPAPAPVAPPKPRTVSMSANDLFDFNSAVLKPKGRTHLDQAVVQPARSMRTLNAVKVGGHTDRLGNPKYNQALSEKRAESVKAYLVSQGVDGGKVQTAGFGETQPVAMCDQKNRKALIDCLAPNRRVVVEIEGN